MKLLDVHARGIGKSAALSEMQILKAISPIEIVSILNKAKISFVLVGAHSLSGWTRKPRATEDVDLVVAEKHLKKATRLLLEAFPHLEAEDHEVVVRLVEKESREVVIDLMKPRGLYRETFKHTHPVAFAGQTYRIPCLEMSLTMKFAAMLSPHRREADKRFDAGDFIRMVEANPDIDLEVLSQLGELVYGGGGAALVELVRKVRAGEKLVL
jgi:hypothetical protein